MSNIVWLHDQDHRAQPFICAGVKSLTDGGHQVCVIDRAVNGNATTYIHLPIRRPAAHAQNTLVHHVAGAWLLVESFRLSLTRRPQIIIATHPSNLVCAWLVARLCRSRLVYYPFEVYGEQYGEVRQGWQFLERWILQHGVDALVTQNEARAGIYVQERRVRVSPLIVHNYKPNRTARRIGKLRELLALPNNFRIVLYEGALMEGRCLAELVQAAAYLPNDCRLVLIGRAKAWWRENVEPMLAQPVLSERVMVLPAVPHSEIMEYIADADVGLIIYDNKVRNNYYCEPGKLSDYVQAGVPVVAPNFPTISAIIKDYGIGCVFESFDPPEIARAISSALALPKDHWTAALSLAREQLIWETQEPVFLRAVLGELV